MIIDKVVLLASALIQNKKGEVLLLKRSNTSKTYKHYWQVPEGKIENGETILQALLRELQEELGLAVNSAKLQSNYIVDFKAVSTHFLVLRTVFNIEEKHNDTFQLSYEHEAFGWFTPNEAIKRLRLVPGIK